MIIVYRLISYKTLIGVHLTMYLMHQLRSNLNCATDAIHTCTQCQISQYIIKYTLHILILNIQALMCVALMSHVGTSSRSLTQLVTCGQVSN